MVEVDGQCDHGLAVGMASTIPQRGSEHTNVSVNMKAKPTALVGFPWTGTLVMDREQKMEKQVKESGRTHLRPEA